jgi:hypothetical protein
MFERLRAAVEEGLGPHHDYTGDCEVHYFDRFDPPVTLRLEPGTVALVPAAPKPRGTLWVQSKALEVMLTGIAFDFRLPEVQQHMSFVGDAEFVVRAVVLALRRPTPEMRDAFRRAEAASRGLAFTAVERVSPGDFRSALARRVPFIVTGALDGWPAIRSFEEWLKQREAVSLGQLVDETRSLGDFVRRALEQPDARSYTHGSPLPEVLESDFPLPDFAKGLQPGPSQLWLGAGRDPQTPITTLHRDAEAGLLGQIHGRKRFTVFPPHQADCLYVRPGYDSYQHCWVAPHRPDLQRYPKYREATPIDFVLEPGELLVQPAGWFHCVYSLDPLTASVSRFIAPA